MIKKYGTIGLEQHFIDILKKEAGENRKTTSGFASEIVAIGLEVWNREYKSRFKEWEVIRRKADEEIENAR